MNAKIKFKCDITVRYVVEMPGAEEVKGAFEHLLREWMLNENDDLTITDFEQEYVNED